MTIVPRTSEGSASSAPLTTAWYQAGKSSDCFGIATGRESTNRAGRLLPLDGPVDDGAGRALLLQEAGDLIRDHHRAVLAARAADGDREVVPPFLDVAGEQELEQVPDAREEALGGLLAENVAPHPAVQAGERPQILD